MKPKFRHALLLASSFAGLAISYTHAADGTWTQNGDGNWSDITKWDSGIVADGTDSTAFLSDVISANRTITLDSARTIGNIFAQDTTHDYIISGANTLTFDVTAGSPTVSVVAGRTLTFKNTTLAGSDGLAFTGAGVIDVYQATFGYTGGTIVDGDED
jgi:hypothetical protein